MEFEVRLLDINNTPIKMNSEKDVLELTLWSTNSREPDSQKEIDTIINGNLYFENSKIISFPCTCATSQRILIFQVFPF